MEFFLCNKCKIAVKPTIYQNWAASKALLGKFSNCWSYIAILNPENYIIPCRYWLLGKTTKQPLSNFDPQKLWKYKQGRGLSPDLV